MKRFILFSVLTSILLSNVTCSKKNTPLETRTFYMGTTPWPADFTGIELDSAYQFINNHCDIVSHHFDEGIPYEEAFYNKPMPASLVQDIAVRKTKTSTGKKIFLSVSALSIDRITRSPYYNNAPVTDSIKNYWRQLPFDHNKVVTAYVNYIGWLIQQLQPIYVNFGVESNASGWNAAQFILYKNFITQVYQQLKSKHAAIPFLISFIVDETNSGFNNARELEPYTDFIGLSAYPYVTVSSSANGNTNPQNFPPNYFEKFTNISPAKPLAFTETGYIAENLSIAAYNLDKQGNVNWQKDYLEKVLQFCNDKKAKLFIWYCSKDYDAGNASLKRLGLYQEILGLWKDIGLKDEYGNERPAYKSWLQWIQKNKTE